MSWDIRYHINGVAGIRCVGTREHAIANVCDLFDRGAEISRIAGDGPNDTLTVPQALALRPAKKPG